MTMTKIFHAVFDGTVLRPEETAGLKVGTRYVLMVESRQKVSDIENDPAFNLSSLVLLCHITDKSPAGGGMTSKRLENKTNIMRLNGWLI